MKAEPQQRRQRTKLQDALSHIHTRMQVVQGSNLTHDELGEIAGVEGRTMGSWMRGESSPKGMPALLELLSKLPKDKTEEVLEMWRAASATKPVRGEE